MIYLVRPYFRFNLSFRQKLNLASSVLLLFSKSFVAKTVFDDGVITNIPYLKDKRFLLVL